MVIIVNIFSLNLLVSFDFYSDTNFKNKFYLVVKSTLDLSHIYKKNNFIFFEISMDKKYSFKI